MRTLLRFFFHLLYHQFAFAYDLVAAIVSFGCWKDWIMEVVPFIEGARTLEIGHGPGHLHRNLLNRKLVAVAIDESAPMGRLAKRRLAAQYFQSSKKDSTNHLYPSDYAQSNLARGLAQHLPFGDEAFDTIISTFPAEYIFESGTLSEVRRCLVNGGRFLLLPVAMPKNRFLSWLFRVTGQASSDALDVIQERLTEPFVEFEFDVEIHVLERRSGTLIIIVAKKGQPS